MNKAITNAKVSLFNSENNDEIFHWLYKEHWQPLINYAYYYVKDYSVAEEVVQQLFIDIFSKNISIGETVNKGSYLRKAVRNRVYNYMQKHKRYQYHLKKQFDKTSLTVGNSFNNKMNMHERQQQISFYLSRLGEPCRTVFILNREQQMTIKEIAQKLSRPKDTVTKQLSRAIRYLHKCIYQTALSN